MLTKCYVSSSYLVHQNTFSYHSDYSLSSIYSIYSFDYYFLGKVAVKLKLQLEVMKSLPKKKHMSSYLLGKVEGFLLNTKLS